MAGLILGCLGLICATAITNGVQVTMPEHKKAVMLFQSTLLRCKYSTSSTQPVMVQWKYKSFCQDRTEEALGIGKVPSKANMGNQYLDCADGSRTVRIVASKQGNTMTLGDFYKGRDITIVNDADLQFGNVHWGDSGLYYCLVVTSDDVEGKNEDRIEVLVMGVMFVINDGWTLIMSHHEFTLRLAKRMQLIQSSNQVSKFWIQVPYMKVGAMTMLVNYNRY
ncbi:immunoglobulin-like domain-containing receptor 2 [Pelobates cultripes]|nr:immunoglobulin-like domain-containing receptor 2 [Pelobates cultripes]